MPDILHDSNAVDWRRRVDGARWPASNDTEPGAGEFPVAIEHLSGWTPYAPGTPSTGPDRDDQHRRRGRRVLHAFSIGGPLGIKACLPKLVDMLDSGLTA